jgi:hypothetical protein
MVGDTADMVGRIRAVLPARWWPLTAPGATSATPLLDGLLTGLAWAWSWLYGLIAYANLQARIATATDVWLDLIALDFFGLRVQRGVSESDIQFGARIEAEVLRPRGTRAALIQALTQLTGRTPTVFEPANTTDTGGWSTGGMGYGVAGGYGDLQLPFQAFVTAFRPAGGGVASVGAYGHVGGFNGMPGGYGVGAVEYAAESQVLGQITDAMIQSAVVNVMPEATIAWLRIRS